MSVLLLLSCSKEGLEVEGHHPLPRILVHLEVSLDHEGRGLREPLSTMAVGERHLEGEHLGHRGILLVHGLDEKYCAFDMACPHCYPQEGKVQVLKGEKWLLGAECPKCHTVYDLSLGMANPVAGEGRYPLLSYRVNRIGEQLVVR